MDFLKPVVLNPPQILVVNRIKVSDDIQHLQASLDLLLKCDQLMNLGVEAILLLELQWPLYVLVHKRIKCHQLAIELFCIT
jgi:hypothetical protein